MLLPRVSSESPATADSPSAAGPSARRLRLQTIDDPPVRHELARLLDEQPLAFLSIAARTVAVHGLATPALVRDLIRSATFEGAAMATALWWLCGVKPPGELLDLALPRWLSELDRVEIVAGRRRREGATGSTASYLAQLRFAGGRRGTLQIVLDHGLGGAIISACTIDETLVATLDAIGAVDRWRLKRDAANRPPPPYRSIKPDVVRRALAGALAASGELVTDQSELRLDAFDPDLTVDASRPGRPPGAASTDHPPGGGAGHRCAVGPEYLSGPALDLDGQWPGLRSLVAFVVLDADAPDPTGSSR